MPDRKILWFSFNLQVTTIRPMKFRVSWPSVKENNLEIDFQVGSRGGHVGFPIRMTLDILIYKSLRYFLSSFESSGFLLKKSVSKWIFKIAA